MNKLFDSTRIRRISKYIFLFVWLLLVFGLLSASCEPSKEDDLENEGQFVNPPDPGESGSLESAQSEGYLEDEPVSDLQEDPGVPIADLETNEGELPKKPVGFVNYGTINATVRPWTYVPLGANEPQTPAPTASTVSSAQGTGGDWPNSSRFITVPLGSYTWCIDWEEGDVDKDGSFDYYHYYTEEPTLLDYADSDELDFAEEVDIMAPPSAAPIYRGKCGEEDISPKYIWVEVGEGDCVGIDVASSDGFIPDDSIAKPGITAICWDNVMYNNYTERVFCTYKSINWDECVGGPNIGKMYTAEEVD
jgi:hypothetical protein